MLYFIYCQVGFVEIAVEDSKSILFSDNCPGDLSVATTLALNKRQSDIFPQLANKIVDSVTDRMEAKLVQIVNDKLTGQNPQGQSQDTKSQGDSQGQSGSSFTTLTPSKPGVLSPSTMRSMSFEDPRLTIKMGPADNIDFDEATFIDLVQTYGSVVAHYLSFADTKKLAWHNPFVLDMSESDLKSDAAIDEAAEQLKTTYKGRDNYPELPELKQMKTFSFTVRLDDGYYTHIYQTGLLYQCCDELNRRAMRLAKAIIAKLGFDSVKHSGVYSTVNSESYESDDEAEAPKAKSVFDTSEYISHSDTVVKILASVGNVLEFVSTDRSESPDPSIFLHEQLSEFISTYIDAAEANIRTAQHRLYVYFGYQIYQNHVHESSAQQEFIKFLTKDQADNPYFQSKSISCMPICTIFKYSYICLIFSSRGRHCQRPRQKEKRN